MGESLHSARKIRQGKVVANAGVLGREETAIFSV